MRILSARLVNDIDGDGFALDLDDRRIAHDSDVRCDDWPDRLEQEVGGDWGQLCDDKAHFALDEVIDLAFTELLGHEPEITTAATLRLLLPEPLGSDRLDALADQIRLADHVAFDEMAGRVCLRFTTDGVTSTSFIDPAERKLLEERLGSLLG